MYKLEPKFCPISGAMLGVYFIADGYKSELMHINVARDIIALAKTLELQQFPGFADLPWFCIDIKHSSTGVNYLLRNIENHINFTYLKLSA